jgi:tRNA modification GTPase
VAANKADLPAAWSASALGSGAIRVSALTGDGLPSLRAALLSGITARDAHRDTPAITNLRHVDLLTRAGAAVDRAAAAARQEVPEEFVLADANEARSLLEEVTGARTPDDVLAEIFARFCIGK